MDGIERSRAFLEGNRWHSLQEIDHKSVCKSPCGEERKILVDKEAFVEFVSTIHGEYGICEECGYEVVCTMSQ